MENLKIPLISKGFFYKSFFFLNIRYNAIYIRMLGNIPIKIDANNLFRSESAAFET